MMLPGEREADREAFVDWMDATAEILRANRAASTTQPGRRTNTPTVVHTYSCNVQAAPTKQYKGQNQITSEADWVICLPANSDVLDSDTIRVTFAETGEIKTYDIVEISRRSGELQRVVFAKGVGAGA